MMNSGQTFVLMMTTIICGTIVILGIARSFLNKRTSAAKKLEGGPVGDFTDRLGRMEQAIDSIAVEVERVSEAQRFVAKLLVDRRPATPIEPP
ncbi:MAG TPA: hypothetical protein VIJ16_09495, partial [Gemmatimonadaceae bacterium]